MEKSLSKANKMLNFKRGGSGCCEKHDMLISEVRYKCPVCSIPTSGMQTLRKAQKAAWGPCAT